MLFVYSDYFGICKNLNVYMDVWYFNCFCFVQNTQLVVFPYPPQTPFNQPVTVQARDKDTLNAPIVFDIETSKHFLLWNFIPTTVNYGEYTCTCTLNVSRSVKDFCFVNIFISTTTECLIIVFPHIFLSSRT